MIKLVITILVAILYANLAYAERRIALVIGNSQYGKGLANLKNPVNDATDIAARLKKYDFSVISLFDANLKEMSLAIESFSSKLQEPNTVGLFYFAGHGIQVQGENFLVPVNPVLHTQADVRYEAISVSGLLKQMSSSKDQLNIIILDACRNNPYSLSMRSVQKGLASVIAPKGALVFYATSPGDVALDGNGRNGVFTEHFLASLDMPSLTIEKVFKKTAINVSKATNNVQVPWMEGVLLGDFYFETRKPALVK